MNYPIEIVGFEGQTLEVKFSTFAGPQLLINGQPAPEGPKRGQMILRRTASTEVIATWKSQSFGLDVPRLVVAGEEIKVVDPLKWYELVWSGWPVVLIFGGGILGGLIGPIAFVINLRILRSARSTPIKFGLTAVVSVLTVVVYLSLVVLLPARLDYWVCG
jgi:hypothetical protein